MRRKPHAYGFCLAFTANQVNVTVFHKPGGKARMYIGVSASSIGRLCRVAAGRVG